MISGTLASTNDDWSTTTQQVALRTSAGTAYGAPARFLDIAIPELTPSVLAGGAILVWMEVTPGMWAPLPYTFRPVLSSFEYRYDIEIRQGTIRILFALLDIDDPSTVQDPLAISQAIRGFRWVIIPPAAVPALASVAQDAGPEQTLQALEREGFAVGSNF